MILLVILAAVILIFWLALLLDPRRRWPADCFLNPPLRASRGGAGANPTVLAVVPARNEAEILTRTLPSLLLQKEQLAGVLLIDDQSTDGTAAAAREIAGRLGASERLWVVAAPPLPAGWTGKVHALSAGIEASQAIFPPSGPEWILFTDADIEHPPHSAAALLQQAQTGPYELVSVMARLHAQGFWERLLIPPFVYFFHLLYPFRQVRDPRSRLAAAAGGCILIQAEALRAAGGLEAIRDALIDDVSLAKAVRAASGRLWLGFDPGLESIRPYRRLRELWGMISRCAFTQLRCRYEVLAAVLLGLAVFFVLPPILFFGAAVALPANGGWSAAAAGLALCSSLSWLAQTWSLLPYVRYHRVPVGFSPLLFLAAFFYGLMTLTSAWNHFRGHGADWNGRFYK